jgi:hypothetical protein
MGGFFTLQVGGVDLNVGCSDMLLHDPGEVAYSTFRSGRLGGEGDSVDISVAVSDPAPPCSARKVWETGEAWSVYHNEGLRLISGPLRHRAWSAEMDGEKVTVKCGPAMLRREGGREMAVNPVRYPLDQILLMYALARRRGMIVHSCGAGFAGKGALFLGRSGAGKSTLARLLGAAGGCTVLSDDRIIVRMFGDKPRMYGTPWPGEAGMAVNASVPLTACFALVKSAENRIEDLPASRVADVLLPVTSVPWYEEEAASAILATCDALAAAVPFRVLHFRRDQDAVAMIRDTVERCQA